MTTPLQAIAQGIFDIVVERGSQMKRRCIDVDGACSYRLPEGGGGCFVGLLLSDDEVKDERGNLIIGGVGSLVFGGQLPERLLPHVSLLRSLQQIHDDPANWCFHDEAPFHDKGPRSDRIAQQLRVVARDFGLKDKTVDEFFPA